MVQINDFEWKDGSQLPECSLTHLGIETSHEVIAVIEDNGYRNTVVLQYHLHNGWEYANGVDLKAVFSNAVVLQWAYLAMGLPSKTYPKMAGVFCRIINPEVGDVAHLLKKPKL